MTHHTPDIHVAVQSAIAELIGTPPDTVGPNDRLRLDLGLDSLQEMELVSRLTEDFDVDPEMEEILAVRTVSDVTNLLSAHVTADRAESRAS